MNEIITNDLTKHFLMAGATAILVCSSSGIPIPTKYYKLENVTQSFTQHRFHYEDYTNNLPYDRINLQFGETTFLANATSENNFRQLEEIYSLENNIKIKEFLSAHKSLYSALFDTYEQVQKVFNKHIANVGLEFINDPDEDFEGLTITIKTDLNPESSINLLDRFDEEWWLDIDMQIKAILTVMVRAI